MCERALWAAVAELAISDHARLIEAARKGCRRILTDSSNNGLSVGSLADEIAAARRYFNSADWREVSSLAGLNLGADDIMAVIQNEWRPYRVTHRVTPMQQGAA